MDVRKILFKYRSYTPIPFILAALILAEPTRISFFVGFALVVAGESIRFWGVAYAGGKTRTTSSVGGSRLVTAGPFAHVRNPLYCGNFLLWIGFLIAGWAWMPWMALIGIAFFAFQYSCIVHLEEEYLSKTFGDTYEAYRRSVRRWIPALRGYRSPEQMLPDWKRALKAERNTFQAIAILFVLIFFRWRLFL
jgi:protein-S-isoprenylcysteine O-methyltransferase Ste14